MIIWRHERKKGSMQKEWPAALLFKTAPGKTELEKTIPSACAFRWFTGETSRIRFWDTWDERLEKKGYTLVSGNHVFTLYQSAHRERERAVSLKKVANMPLAADAFPEGDFRRELEALAGIRSVLPSVEIEKRSSAFSVLNQDQKTIARASWTEITVPETEASATAVVIQPLRGYEDETEELIRRFPAHERFLSVDELLRRFLPAKEPYLSRPVLDFDVRQGMAPALHKILSAHFRVMRRNEEGVLENWDTEFLHDFRVAGRRMRSALSLIKPILHPGVKQELVLTLKKLGRYTGPVRDLDVYLLARDEFEKMIPGEMAGSGFRAFFHRLSTDRKRKFKALKTFLESEEYRGIIKTWNKYLESWEKNVIHNPDLTDMASALLKKHFRKILKEGGELKPSSSEEQFHELRIEAKKLRYLLEFFSSLFPGEIVRDSVRQLKAFQDILGAFNDYSVQIEMLGGYLRSAEKKKDQEQIKSLSALIAVCFQGREKLKRDYVNIYKAFSGERNMLLYQQLWGGSQ